MEDEMHWRKSVVSSYITPRLVPPWSARRLFIHQPRTCDRDTARLSKRCLVTDYLGHRSAHARTPSPQWKFSIRRHWVSIKVTMVIYTPGGGGADTCVLGSARSDGGVWIPIRGLTFRGRSSNAVPARGQELCAPGLVPRGLEKSYERKVKARERWKRGSAALIIPLRKMSEKTALDVDKFVSPHFSPFLWTQTILSDLSPCNQILVARHTRLLSYETRWRSG